VRDRRDDVLAAPTLISTSSLTAPAMIALTVPTSWFRALDFIGCSSRN
jgi:hypothetical protein